MMELLVHPDSLDERFQTTALVVATKWFEGEELEARLPPSVMKSMWARESRA